MAKEKAVDHFANIKKFMGLTSFVPSTLIGTKGRLDVGIIPLGVA